MEQRKLGPYEVSAISVGCMNLSHAYGKPPAEDYAIRLLNEALDLGYTHLDTAALYGFGHNEELLNKAVMHRRNEFILASKCGIYKDEAGNRVIDCRPETVRKTVEDSLRRLGTDVIDLYYLHRMDKTIPIEESVGELSRLVGEGKIKTIGLSEVSAENLRKAHATHPIAALQTEYSLWARNAEIAVLDACKELGISFVAFSPVARGYLCDLVKSVDELDEKDIRRGMPRFNHDNYPKNLALLEDMRAIAKQHDASMAQVALVWLLSRGSHIVAIPGTSNIDHLRENYKAADVKLSGEELTRLDASINQHTVFGPRYSEALQADVDTEEF